MPIILFLIGFFLAIIGTSVDILFIKIFLWFIAMLFMACSVCVAFTSEEN